MQKSARKGESGSILIYAYFPGRCVVQIHVDPRSLVSELHHFFPAERLSFIAHGIHLGDAFTLDSYSIHDKDVIIALPIESPPSDVHKWCTATDDTEVFADQVGFLVGQGTSREVARLRDFQMIRLEKRPRSFRRFISAYRPGRQPCTPTSPICQLTVGDRSVGPNADPLPVMWRTGDGSTPVAAAPIPVEKDRPNLEIVSINDEV
jgi:hypothetical protein